MQRRKSRMKKAKKLSHYSGKDHTFVICAYKESPYLEECIQSLKKQSVSSDILMATSTPNEFLKALSEKYKIKLFINQGEKGIAGDWNFAYSIARTPLVTLAHQDDLYMKDYVKMMLKSLNEAKKPLIAFSDYYERRNGETVKNNKLLRVKRFLLFPLRFRLFWGNRWIRRRILSLGSPICCPAVTMVKTELPMSLFENNMKSNIDWQAWEKISKQKGSFVYIPIGLMEHRIHSDSTTSEVVGEKRRREEDLIMYRKFWPEWIARILEHFYQSSEESNKI